MKLLKSVEAMKKYRTDNPNTIIGTLKMGSDKVFTDHVVFTLGHQACLDALRAAGCEIIFLEFVPVTDFYGVEGKYKKDMQLPPNKVLKMCEDLNIDAEFLIYGVAEMGTCPAETKALVAQRMLDQNYKEEADITDLQYIVLKTNLSFITFRGYIADYVVRSIKNGSESYALKHYLKTYQPQTKLLEPDIIYNPGTKIPVGPTDDIDEVAQEAKDFATYFHNISKEDLQTKPDVVKTNLMAYAESLGYKATNINIQTSSKYVEPGEVFASAVFRGPGNIQAVSTRHDKE